MNIVPIEPILQNREVGPLTLAPLFALQTNRDPYQALLLQPQGLIEASSHRIGHADRENAYTVCRRFLDLAVARQADLVVSPEYCMPWRVIGDVFAGEIAPPHGTVWAMGCESITPNELRQIGQDLNGRADIFFYHQEIDAREEANKTYIDPLVYVFWSTDAQGNWVLCTVVQFKTSPCRDERDVEQNSLYCGSEVYVFNRGLNRIALLGLVCSDAFGFTEKVDEYHTNSLILHIQLNPKPAHVDYAAYRAKVCSVGSNNAVEMLCLNWAQDVIEIRGDGTRSPWQNIAGSAWYVSPRAFKASDSVVDEVHRGGLYYSVLAKRWHAFFLNYAPQVISLTKQKLFFAGAQALAPVTCIAVRERWLCSEALEWTTGSVAVDGFERLAGEFGGIGADLTLLCATSPLAVERALELLAGPLGNPDTWHTLQELHSLQLEAEESLRRVTVHQETSATQPAVIFRKKRLQRAQTAISLPRGQVPWPASVRDLENGFKYHWKGDDPHCNVLSAAVDRGAASLLYLDDEPTDGDVESMLRRLTTGLANHAVSKAHKLKIDIRDAVARAADRLCIVFRRNQIFHTRSADGLAIYTRPANASPNDIAGESND